MKRSLFTLILTFCFILPTISSADVWQKDVFDSTGTSTGVNCSIALDSDGNPHISYANTEDLYLHYAHYDGSAWSVTSVDSFGITGLHTSIALDSQDRPHISYTAHILDLRHVYWDDTGWVNQFVDSGVNPGIQGFRTSIAMDHNDNPHIAYFNDDSGWVVYTMHDGDSWNTQFLQDITGSIYLNLILKDDSIPYIGYHIFDEDIANDTLRIAYWDNSKGSWQFETMPELTCPAGIYFQSFDMDSQGNCYFAYQIPYSIMSIPMPCTADPAPFRTIAKFDGASWSYEVVPNPPGDPFEIYVSFPLFLKFDNNDNPAFLADTILYWKKDGTNWSYYGLGNQMGDEVAVFQQLIFDEYNYPNMVFGQPWAVYYKLYPGDPQINVPFTSHAYSENYESWNCLIQNLGEAPVIVDSLKFKKTDSTFRVMNDNTPFYIHSGQSDSISIRFMPEAELTYYDTLLIYNNDSSNLIVEVTLEGTGSFDPTTGDLAVFTHNCYAAPEYHSLNYELPLAGVSVSLYQSDVLHYGPIVSDFVGLAMQADIIPGTYEVRMEKTVAMPGDKGKANHTLKHAVSIDIGTGLVTDTLILPESLMVQNYQWVYNNSHIVDGDKTYIYPADADDIGSIPNMLDSWCSSLDSNKIESAARLILAQEMVDKVFFTGQHLGKTTFEGISDLLHFSIKATESSGGWALKILKIIKIIGQLWAGDKAAAMMELMQMLAEYLVIYMIDMMIDEVSQQLPCLEDPTSGFEIVCTGDILKAVWKDVKNNYSNWSLPDAENAEEMEDSWDHLNNLVYRTARNLFTQILYIDILTNPKLEKAQDRSQAFNYTSDFPDASESGADGIAIMKVTADNVNDAAKGMITAADLIMKSVMAMAIAQAFLPSVSVLENIKTISMYASIGLDIAATGVALGGFFNIPFDMNDAVDAIYFPDAKSPPGFKRVPDNLPKATANAQILTMLKQRIINSVNEYDSISNVVKTHIQSDSIESAMLATGDLALADVNLMRTVNVSMAPAYAVAHALYDSLPGFNTLYDGMISDGSFAGMTRYFNYLSLVQLSADSSVEMKDYLTTHLDSGSYFNHTWTDGSLELLDSLFGIEIPGIVVASQASQDKFGLDIVDDTATITVVLQNVGALTADSISIVFETNDGLATTAKADSLYVGSLAPGEESGIYKWFVVMSDSAQHRGMWDVNVISSNAKTYSPAGSFAFKLDAPVSVDDEPINNLLPNKFKLGQNHPNPFNMTTRIEYSLTSRNNVTISIFNLLGQKIKTVIDESKPAGNYEVTWDGTDENNSTVASGVYFYRIKVGDFEDSKKMLLLK